MSEEVNALSELEISVKSQQFFTFAATTSSAWAWGTKGLGDLIAVKRGVQVPRCCANNPLCTFTIVTNCSFLYKDTFICRGEKKHSFKVPSASVTVNKTLLLVAFQDRSCGSSQTAPQYLLGNAALYPALIVFVETGLPYAMLRTGFTLLYQFIRWKWYGTIITKGRI